MQPFFPGQDYGSPFTAIIWVCVNPVDRSFEACDMTTSVAVYTALKQAIAEKGLSREILVAQSSCVLGCSASGATVVVAHRERPAQYYKAVGVSDVENVFESLCRAL